MELDLSNACCASIEDYLQIIKDKTASLVEASARSGAVIAGMGQDLVDACGELGQHFGIAFQIIDDLLDYGVGAEDLGKNLFGDLSRGLATLPMLLYAKDHPGIKEEFQALSAEQIVARLDETGCFEKTKALAMAHLDEAAHILDKLPQSAATDILRSYFKAVADRSN
jgi:octaprenyl-diphosphate synthase